MQIQQVEVPITMRLLGSDPFIEKLFSQSQVLLKQLQFQQNQDKQQNGVIQVVREKIEKGYMSEDEEKAHALKPYRRINSIIHKIKLKERKRKTRQKKIYIEMLQNRVLQLQKSLQTANKLNQMNKQYLKRLSGGQKIMNGLFVSKQRHIQNLQFLLKQKQVNNQALKKQYCNMRSRQGVYGTDCTKAINYYFSQMSEMFFPDTLKYLIKTAQNEQDFFDPQLLKNGYYSRIKSPQDIAGNLKLPSQSIIQLAYLKQQILGEKKVLDAQFEKFYNSKCQILKTARKFEIMIDSMQRYSNHEQNSKLIVLTDIYRYEKSISVKQFHKELFDKLAKQKYQYDPNNLFGKTSLD